MVDRTHLEYRRRLPFPIDAAYAWLTDYEETDPERAGGIIQARENIREEDGRIVFDGHVQTLGRDAKGHAEIELDPPNHWTAYLHDAKGRLGDIYDYRLEPVDDGQEACELIVDYGFAVPKLKHKIQTTLAKPLVHRKIDQMWDGFVASMEEELTASDPPA